MADTVPRATDPEFLAVVGLVRDIEALLIYTTALELFRHRPGSLSSRVRRNAPQSPEDVAVLSAEASRQELDQLLIPAGQPDKAHFHTGRAVVQATLAGIGHTTHSALASRLTQSITALADATEARATAHIRAWTQLPPPTLPPLAPYPPFPPGTVPEISQTALTALDGRIRYLARTEDLLQRVLGSIIYVSGTEWAREPEPDQGGQEGGSKPGSGLSIARLTEGIAPPLGSLPSPDAAPGAIALWLVAATPPIPKVYELLRPFLPQLNPDRSPPSA